MSPHTPVTLSPEEQEFFNAHEPIIRRAAAQIGFRTMPQGGAEAVQAGIVTQNDPNWHMSDAYHACDSFRLTELGTKLALAQGWLRHPSCCWS